MCALRPAFASSLKCANQTTAVLLFDTHRRRPPLIILGLILLIVGWLLSIGILQTLGIILIAIGLVLVLVNHPGPVGGRWW